MNKKPPTPTVTHWRVDKQDRHTLTRVVCQRGFTTCYSALEHIEKLRRKDRDSMYFIVSYQDKGENDEESR